MGITTDKLLGKILEIVRWHGAAMKHDQIHKQTGRSVWTPPGEH